MLRILALVAVVWPAFAIAQTTAPSGTPDSEEEDAAPAIPTVRPPQEIRRYFIDGELIDPAETLQAFLDPLLKGANWSEALEDRVLELLSSKLRYRGVARTRPYQNGGISLVLTLEPIVTVRYILVDIEAGAAQRLREPIFADEVQRRMTLRPGSSLAKTLPERRDQLRNEADRLARFLRNDGFFDAEVRIEERPIDAYSAKLNVFVKPGQGYRVGKIDVVGNANLPAADIREKFRHERFCTPLVELCFGTARFTRSRLNQDIDAVADMYKKRGYPGVRVRTNFHPSHSFKRDTKTVEFTVEIRERRKIDVVFEGDKTTDALKKEITLAKEGSYDDVEVEASVAAIRAYYQRKGHFEASVAAQRARFEFFERIIFSIDKGPQLKVRRISFSGNKAISSGKLRDLIKTARFRRIIIGESGGYATSTQLAQDSDRIKAEYAKRGYADAEVNLRVSRTKRKDANAAALAAAVASRKKADGLYVHFAIEEGSLLMVNDVEVEFQGLHTLPPENILKDNKLRVGKPFRPDEVERDVRRIRQRYLKQGFPRAEVESSWKRTARGRVKVTFEVAEGTPARIGKLLLRGNYKTADWVIRDEMELKEGELLTLERTERAQANLRRSGLFSSVRIKYLGAEDSRRDSVNVLVDVEEGQDVPLWLSTGGGYSTDSKLFAEAGATVPNVAGTGADFDLRGQYGQEIQSLQSNLTLPRWIMRRAIGTAFAWDLRGFLRNEFTQRFGDLRSWGGTLSATKQGTRGFFEGWLLAMRYDFRQRNRDEDLVRPAGNSDDVSRSKVATRVSAIGPVLVIDKRKDAKGQRNPLAPREGWRLELRSSFAEDVAIGSLVGATNRFVKLGGSTQHFWSFAKRFRLSNAVRYDHGIPLGGEVLLPGVERFFAGGDTTVRGLEEDRLATELVIQDVPPATGLTQVRVLPAGGNIRFIHNIELEVIAYQWTSVSLASAIYIDTGLVTNSLDGVRFSDLRHSIGMAIARIVTPIGSLSAEWALPFDPKIGDNPRGRLHIIFGFLFG